MIGMIFTHPQLDPNIHPPAFSNRNNDVSVQNTQSLRWFQPDAQWFIQRQMEFAPTRARTHARTHAPPARGTTWRRFKGASSLRPRLWPALGNSYSICLPRAGRLVCLVSFRCRCGRVFCSMAIGRQNKLCQQLATPFNQLIPGCECWAGIFPTSTE